ncbi:MAG: hypothetical protein ACQCN3_13385 [Candidatus Bathyarchaeia archaeon]
MPVEQFVVQQTSITLTIIPIVLIILGAVLLSAGFSKKLAHLIATYSLKARPTENRYVYLITGAIVIGIGAVIFMGNAIPSTITVGDQYISYQSSFLGAGSMNIPADQIANAYVAQLNQGDLTMSRTFGTASGDVCVGLFALGNGHTAHVLTNNNTSLIIELTNGEYVILGVSDMDALAVSFSQNVYALQQQIG